MSAASTVSPLEAHLGYWLRYVSNQVSHGFGVKLAARDVTVAEWVVLRELFDDAGTMPSVLADRLGMSRGAISKLADRLIAKQLIVRTADDADRRVQSIALTPSGRALVPELSALADANDAEFFGHIDPATRAIIEDAMKQIVERRGIRTVPVT